MAMKRFDVAIGFVLLILSIIVLSIASQFPEGQGTDVGAKFFPSVYAYILTGLSVLLIISPVLKRKRDEEDVETSLGMKKAIIGMVGTFIYYWLIQFFGFFISTVIFLGIMMWIFNYRKPVLIIVFSILISAVMYVGFAMLLNVPLPSGNLFE
ncbi:YjbE family integral membrane protein [Sporosarcina newyorkensis 2681]|uniref:YjbE family integral membrane protein n=1 Tax=Sporosarcina newyorkensis 2681 TaxID=1027292 RepID=F9DRR2_9BACL|nr:tripartite tricarboxylate transporter TctB family protein [Sporosarcina newyorkensis]EGQ26565.1 YjbE family integral membrane protein [Sporosarcina newyorkensis 2681]